MSFVELIKENNININKILGIEPILYENCPTCSDYRHDACFYHGCCDGLDLHATESVINDEIFYKEYGYKIEQYVNFNNPINFVKLVKCICFCVGGLSFKFQGNTAKVLFDIYGYLSDEYLSENVLSLIREKVKNTEWEY